MYDLIPKKSFPFWKKDWEIEDSFSDVFNHFFNYSGYNDELGNLIYEMEVPGFNKDNLTVEISDGILTIQGKKEIKNKNSICKSKVFRQINVGDIDNVNAKLKDGMLTLTLKHLETETKKIELM